MSSAYKTNALSNAIASDAEKEADRTDRSVRDVDGRIVFDAPHHERVIKGSLYLKDTSPVTRIAVLAPDLRCEV